MFQRNPFRSLDGRLFESLSIFIKDIWNEEKYVVSFSGCTREPVPVGRTRLWLDALMEEGREKCCLIGKRRKF